MTSGKDIIIFPETTPQMHRKNFTGKKKEVRIYLSKNQYEHFRLLFSHGDLLAIATQFNLNYQKVKSAWTNHFGPESIMVAMKDYFTKKEAFLKSKQDDFNKQS